MTQPCTSPCTTLSRSTFYTNNKRHFKCFAHIQSLTWRIVTGLTARITQKSNPPFLLSIDRYLNHPLSIRKQGLLFKTPGKTKKKKENQIQRETKQESTGCRKTADEMMNDRKVKRTEPLTDILADLLFWPVASCWRGRLWRRRRSAAETLRQLPIWLWPVYPFLRAKCATPTTPSCNNDIIDKFIDCYQIVYNAKRIHSVHVPLLIGIPAAHFVNGWHFLV